MARFFRKISRSATCCEKDLKQAAVSKIVIERPHRKCRISIHSARPGIVIGKKGADIEKIRAKVKKFTNSEVHINIVEVRKPETDATLVAQGIAQQLERRVAFRRAMKRAVQTAMRMGARVSASMSAAVSAAPISPGPNGIAKAACRCTRCVPTWTMALPKPRPPTGSSGSRSGSSRARSWNTIHGSRAPRDRRWRGDGGAGPSRSSALQADRNREHAATETYKVP